MEPFTVLSMSWPFESNCSWAHLMSWVLTSVPVVSVYLVSMPFWMSTGFPSMKMYICQVLVDAALFLRSWLLFRK